MLRNLKKQLVQSFSSGYFWFKFPREKQVYLTFDDGPNKKFTPEILSILDDFSIQSTFFLVGKQVDKYPQIVKQTDQKGHAIGLHTYSHKTMDLMSENEFNNEVAKNQSGIHEIIGKKPTILRPPEGVIKFKNLLWAKKNKIRIIHFTITTNDWKATSVDDILKDVPVDTIKGGEIISFHDNNQYTIKALPLFLKALSFSGFSFAPIIL